MDGMNNNQAVEQSKKGKGALIAIIIVAALALAAGGFAFYWFNRPIYKVTKAIEAGDYKSAVSYYGKLKDEEQEDVAESFVDYCEEIKDEYVDEDSDYDDVMDELDIFEDVLSDDRDYQNIVESVTELKGSRDAWEEAEKLYAQGDYGSAAQKYSEVIKADKNYSKAKELIDECNIKNVVGTWVTEVDLSDIITEQIGVDGLDVNFVLRIKYIFDEDGTVVIATDDDNIKQQMEVLIVDIIDMVIEQYCDSYGVSASDMDALFISTYGMTFSEYVKAGLDINDIIPSNIYQHKDCTYRVDGKDIVLMDEAGNESSEKLQYIGDGTMELNSEEKIEGYAAMGIELPLILNKE